MPDGSGFDMLEKASGQKFDVIFTTATDKFALKAIKYSAIDYLLKPIDVEDLKIAVEKIKSKKKISFNIRKLNTFTWKFKNDDNNFNKITLPTGNAYEIVEVKTLFVAKRKAVILTFFNWRKNNGKCKFKTLWRLIAREYFYSCTPSQSNKFATCCTLFKRRWRVRRNEWRNQSWNFSKKKDAFLQRLNKA